MRGRIPESDWKHTWGPKVFQGEGMERGLTTNSFIYGLLEKGPMKNIFREFLKTLSIFGMLEVKNLVFVIYLVRHPHHAMYKNVLL